MYTDKIKALLKKTGYWIKTHGKLFVCAGIACGVLTVLIGLSLCALQKSPFPADREAAAQEAVSIVESKKTAVMTDTPAEPDKMKETDTETEEEKATSGIDTSPGAESDKTEKPQKHAAETRVETAAAEADKEQTPEMTIQAVAEETETERVAETETERAAETEAEQTAEATAETVSEETGAEPVTEPVMEEMEVQQAVPVHVHSWVPVITTVHHDAITHSEHHDAETQVIHHDAETHEEPVYEFRTICNTCGADITGTIPDHIGPVCQGSYSVQQVQTGINMVIDREGYDEEVTVREAWDENVTDQEAYDEEVTAGYRCRECGVYRG